MDVFDLQAKITLDSSGFESELARSRSGLEELVTKANLFANAITELGKKAADIFFDVAESIIKVGAGFDTAMANVAAISGASGDSLDALRDKAKEMGATTKFSASEAADAFGYMAMAGWKTEDMLAGIDGIMNLAAASGEDLATTSDIVTDALTAFGLSAEDAGHFADILAAASSNANTNVSMMGETFKYVAPLAGTLGYSAEDVAVAVGLMANSGIKAGQAGTSLRAALSSLLNPSEKAAGLMEDLGISMTDVNGNSLPLADTFDMLREAFSGLAESEQASAAAVLFGQEAMSGMLSVINAAPADIEKLTEAVANAEGAAQSMSAIMQDNVGGAWDEFTSAIEGAQIALYDTFSDDLQDMILGAADGVSRLTSAFEEGGASGAASEFGTMLSEGIGQAVTAINDLTGIDLSGVVSGISNAISGIGSAVSSVFEGLDLGRYVENILGVVEPLASGIGDMFSQIDLSGVSEMFVEMQTTASESMQGIIEAIDFTAVGEAINGAVETVSGAVLSIQDALKADGIDGAATAFAEAISSAFSEAGPKIMEAGSAILENVGGVVTQVGEFIYSAMPEIVQGLITSIGGFFESFAGYVQTLWNWMQPLVTFLTSTFVDGLQIAFQQIGTIIETIITALTSGFDFLAAQFDVLTALMQGDFQAAAEAVKAAWDSVLAFFGSVANGIMDIFNSLAASMASIGKNMLDGLKSGFSGIGEWVKSAAGSITSGFKDLFDINSPSRVFAEYGKFMAQGLEVGWNSEMSSLQRTMSDGIVMHGKVDFSNSAIGKASAASINGMISSAQTGGQPVNINLNVDGRTLATVLFDPLNNVIKQKGVTLGA